MVREMVVVQSSPGISQEEKQQGALNEGNNAHSNLRVRESRCKCEGKGIPPHLLCGSDGRKLAGPIQEEDKELKCQCGKPLLLLPLPTSLCILIDWVQVLTNYCSHSCSFMRIISLLDRATKGKSFLLND